MRVSVNLSRLTLISLLTLGCSEGAGTAATEACGPAGEAHGSLGINLAAPAAWIGDRPFMNLLIGAKWFSVRQGLPWKDLPLARLSRDGFPTDVLPGEAIAIGLTPPYGSNGSVRIECRFEGRGALEVGGAATDVAYAASSVRFTWSLDSHPPEGVWLMYQRQSDGAPLRITDCREQSADPSTVFHPAFLEFLTPFSTLRFMDWGRTNANDAVSWSSRTQPANVIQDGPDGIALEHRFALANVAGTDVWLALPWNADTSYLEGAARLARSQLPRGRKLYVEIGNEVWNWGFPVATQARLEGEKLGLALPHMHRYAQRSMETFAIFSKEFKDRPNDLIRVLSTQNANPRTAEEALSYPGVADVTDALAIAPYFGHSRKVQGNEDVEQVLFDLDRDLQETFAFAERNRAIARRYNLDLIAYEGGQHVMGTDIQAFQQLQRHAVMERLYADYLRGWQPIGGLMMLFNSTGPAGKFGAWGLREWSGQDPAQTPKLRAVRKFHQMCRSKPAPAL